MSSHPGASSAPTPSPGERRTLRARVLVVDDEAMVLRVIARLLERSGYQVTVDNCPADALARIHRDPLAFDVLVTDMTMPEMSGIELARGASAAGARMPVVLISGWIDAEAEREARAAGIARVLTKPVEMATLVEALASVVPETRH